MTCPGSNRFHGHVAFHAGPLADQEIEWRQNMEFPSSYGGYKIKLESSHQEDCGGICLHAFWGGDAEDSADGSPRCGCECGCPVIFNDQEHSECWCIENDCECVLPFDDEEAGQG
jgi:hypothetical protein